MKNVLSWAYWNDAVSSSTFSQKTLEGYKKQGLLEYKCINRFGYKVYWITQKGLDILKTKYPKAYKSSRG